MCVCGGGGCGGLQIERLTRAALESSSSAEARLAAKVAEAERLSVAQGQRLSELSTALVKERRAHQKLRSM
jgi:hypothetical protein